MRRFLKLVCLVSLIFSSSPIFPQSTWKTGDRPLEYFKTYRKEDLKTAVDLANKIFSDLKNQEFQYPLEAAAAVFPELLRYSSEQDEMESFMNQLLSLTSSNYGFSIGMMQMKPVFAQDIELIVSQDKTLASDFPKLYFPEKDNSYTTRLQRINRLKQYEYQLEYLKAFVTFTLKNLDLEQSDSQTKIKYLSAAYNSGMRKSKSVLDQYMTSNTYPSGQDRLYFNYTQVSLEASSLIGK